MGILHDFMRIKGKMKILAIIAIGAWFMSIYFSKMGFAIEAPNTVWLGWGLGILITGLELALNDRTQKINMSLLVFGIIAYGYGIYTNVTGFWDAQNPGVPFPWFDTTAILAWFVGIILEFVPEPLFMFALGRARESDPLGALSDAASGKLNLDGDNYRPNENQNRHNNQSYQPKDNQRRPNSDYRPAKAGSILDDFLAKRHNDE